MASKTRLAADFAALQKFTAPGEGITRLAFSEEERQAGAYVTGLMEEAGLTVRVDSFGNIIGRREGSDPSLPAVMFGSHLDSVPNGGNFDGVVGVLGAIEAIRRMNETGFQHEHPIEAVVFMCEESSRFGVATLGSRAMRGLLSRDEASKLVGKDGKSLDEVLKARGFAPERVAQAKYDAPLKAFLELHIEQGKSLECAGAQIGIVTGIAAPTRFRIVFDGRADHSGATPMALRRDGMCAAAEVVLAVERLASQPREFPVVGTTGIVRVSPGVMNVVPGRVELGVDIRSISGAVKAAVAAELREAIAAISRRRGIAAEVVTLTDEEPVRLPDRMLDFLEDICRASGAAWRRLPSGAGHDAMHWAASAPTGMLFIPCRGGVSHNPAEWAELEDIAAATEILYEAVCRLSKRSFVWA